MELRRKRYAGLPTRAAVNRHNRAGVYGVGTSVYAVDDAPLPASRHHHRFQAFQNKPERADLHQRKRAMTTTQQIRTAILRRPEVEARTGLSRSTIYDRIKQGTFPAPVQLGEKAVGWIESEIEAFLAARIAERDATAKTA